MARRANIPAVAQFGPPEQNPAEVVTAALGAISGIAQDARESIEQSLRGQIGQAALVAAQAQASITSSIEAQIAEAAVACADAQVCIAQALSQQIQDARDLTAASGVFVDSQSSGAAAIFKPPEAIPAEPAGPPELGPPGSTSPPPSTDLPGQSPPGQITNPCAKTIWDITASPTFNARFVQHCTLFTGPLPLPTGWWIPVYTDQSVGMPVYIGSMASVNQLGWLGAIGSFYHRPGSAGGNTLWSFGTAEQAQEAFADCQACVTPPTVPTVPTVPTTPPPSDDCTPICLSQSVIDRAIDRLASSLCDCLRAGAGAGPPPDQTDGGSVGGDLPDITPDLTPVVYSLPASWLDMLTFN